MGYGDSKKRREARWALRCAFFLLFFWEMTSAQVRYSVQEEVREGTFVGALAKDLGIDLGIVADRRFRIVSATKQQLFQINQEDGSLLVNQNIDREELCSKIPQCVVNIKAVVENPLEVHHVAVEIVDVNDYTPIFPKKEKRLEIPESAITGARFQLEEAHDPDVGLNGLRSYKLSPNEHFELDVRDIGDYNKVPYLVLRKAIDRERVAVYNLTLTAFDGGKPPKSSTLNISVIVSDVNDNAPVFVKQKYSVTLRENVPIGTFAIQVSASDLDEGLNGEVEYSFGNTFRSRVSDVFDLNPNTGEIRVIGLIDYEEEHVYNINVQATDKGHVPLISHCEVLINVEDVNDNVPEIEITSLSSVVPEDAPRGTVIALISVTDLDSGVNGQVICKLPDNIPFNLKPSTEAHFYSLVTKDHLDRESVPHYDITIVAHDLGSPQLSFAKTIRVDLSDTNDNAPKFPQDPYTLYLDENNDPGKVILSVTATDADENENAVVSYMLGNEFVDTKITPFLNINSENGNIYSLKSFDFETLKTFKFQLVAKDAGKPSLCSNVTVNVFILDQNDNTPVVLSPVSSNGSTEGVQEIPRNVNAGHLVTKVRAYDPDIGYNGWLSFSLQYITDPSLFSLERYTGQIRTLRQFAEADEAGHKLVILVKDNGNVSLSAMATVIINAVETKEAISASDIKSTVKEEANSLTFYLIISLGSVSALFAISIIGLIVMQCSKPTDYSSKYSRDSNYVDTSGTLCHSIQYRSGDKRYMLVGPRMSIGSAIVPGSNGNTLVVPEHRKRASGENLSLHRLQHRDT